MMKLVCIRSFAGVNHLYFYSPLSVNLLIKICRISDNNKMIQQLRYQATAEAVYRVTKSIKFKVIFLVEISVFHLRRCPQTFKTTRTTERESQPNIEIRIIIA